MKKKAALSNKQGCEQYFTVLERKRKERKEMREKEKKKKRKKNKKRNLGLKIQGSSQEYGLVSYK